MKKIAKKEVTFKKDCTKEEVTLKTNYKKRKVTLKRLQKEKGVIKNIAKRRRRHLLPLTSCSVSRRSQSVLRLYFC